MVGTHDRRDDALLGDQPRLGTHTFEVWECLDCDHRAVTLDPSATLECDGEPMRRVPDATATLRPAEVGAFLATHFDIPAPSIEVPLIHVIEGICSVSETADRLGYDTELVRTQLDRLVDAGLLERTSLPRETGDEVSVYHGTESGASTPTTLGELYRWARAASGAPSLPPERLRPTDQRLSRLFLSEFGD